MLTTRAYAAPSVSKPLVPFSIERRDPGPADVLIDILFCGVCHSDIHQARDEWGGSTFPMVPGHEIVGRVKQVGSQVTKLRVGDLAGVGVIVDSCRECEYCRRDLEPFCEVGGAFTYNSTEMDRKTPTQGGYSTQIVVADRFALKIPAGLDLAATAPLLCAGITTYSPLKQWDCKPGARVGVVGLGGLGHLAVKFAAAMGADVTVLSTSKAKEEDAQRLGARGFELTRDPKALAKLAGRFDLLVDAVSAPHDYDAYLKMLRPYGTMAIVGLPSESTPLRAQSLVGGNKRLVGSMVGGMAETQEMLDYCGAHGIVSDIEVIPIQKINEAWERVVKGDVRYRFVIDIASLAS
jgi:uncharacterized zinc-type alcohol dehydrogenase-like protein